jgi:hypothetical protein
MALARAYLFVILLVTPEVLIEWILWPLDLCVLIVVFVEVIELIEICGQVGQIGGIEIELEALSWRLVRDE